jgi:hypothetical protein
VKEITDSLARAFDRIDDFQSVQAGASSDELRDAVTLLQESVGINDDERSLIAQRLEDIRGTKPAAGSALLGLIVGLMAGEEA